MIFTLLFFAQITLSISLHCYSLSLFAQKVPLLTHFLHNVMKFSPFLPSVSAVEMCDVVRTYLWVEGNVIADRQRNRAAPNLAVCDVPSNGICRCSTITQFASRIWHGDGERDRTVWWRGDLRGRGEIGTCRRSWATAAAATT